MRQEQAQISFRHNALVTASNPITLIPFIDQESRKPRELLEPKMMTSVKLLPLILPKTTSV